VLASGAAMVAPAWLPDELRDAGPVPDLRTAMQDLVRHNRRQAGVAVLYDLDHTEGTYAAAEKLHALFERVVVVTPLPAMARDTPLVTRQGIVRRFAEKHIAVLTSHDLVLDERFAEAVVSAVHVYTREETALDNVAFLAYATPRAPDDALWRALRERVTLHRVGDCLAARGVQAATSEGHAAGMAA
jgi:hypothetical protein